MGVIFSTLLLLAHTMFTSFSAVGFSRQRTEATALANQALEQVRALPFDLLSMSLPDLAGGGDTQVKTCQAPLTGYCFPNLTGRVIPAAVYGTGTPTTPFFNSVAHPANQPDHVTTKVGNPGITTYTIKSFITIDPTDLTGQTKVATVQVSWTPAQVGGVSPNVQVETKIHTSPFSESPPGSTTTTTVAAVHGYTALAQSQAGSIVVSGTVVNLNAANVTFNLPNTKAYLSGNTTVGTSTGPAGNLVAAGTASSGISAVGVPIINTPGALATATSPSGSPTNGPNNDSKNPAIFGAIPGSVNQCTLLLVCNLIGGVISGGLAVGQVNSGSALAASSAAGTVNIPSGVIPNNNLGYGKALATQSGALSSNLAVTVASIPLLDLGLVNLVPSGNINPDSAEVKQNGTAAVPLAQTFSAAASKSFTELDVLSGIPVVGTLIKLTGFSATATACAGPGSCPLPTVTEGGTLTIAGLAPITLAASPTPISIGVPPVNITTGLLNVAVTANVTIGSAKTTGSSTATVTSPLSVNVHLGISTLLGTVVDISVVVDLGTVTATATYS